MSQRLLLLMRLAIVLFFLANVWWTYEQFQRLQAHEQSMLAQEVDPESVVKLHRLSTNFLHSEALTILIGIGVLVSFRHRAGR